MFLDELVIDDTITDRYYQKEVIRAVRYYYGSQKGGSLILGL